MENIGLSLTTASNAALIVASYPAMTTLSEVVVYKVRPSSIEVLGTIVAILGVFILTSTDGSSGDNQNELLGNLILIATGIVWACYNFMTHKIVNKYPAITVSFYQTIAGTVCFLPLTFIEKAHWVAPTVVSLMALLYLGVLCSVVAFLLYNNGLRKISPSASVTLMNLVPIFCVIFLF